MKRRGLLLDRDGVMNVNHGYVSRFEKIDFLPGLFPFLRKARDLGYRIAIVTNQSGVARGYYTKQDYETLMTQMTKVLCEEGVEIDLALACFTHPEGIHESLARESFFRKPNPGLLLQAALQLDLDLTRSLMIGDKETDAQAALAAGVGQIFLLGEAGATRSDGVRLISSFEAAL